MTKVAIFSLDKYSINCNGHFRINEIIEPFGEATAWQALSGYCLANNYIF